MTKLQTIAVPVRPRRLATQQRILHALESVLNEQGFSNLTIGEVAQRAGVSRVLVYRYFGSIENLLLAYNQQSRYQKRSAVFPDGPTFVWRNRGHYWTWQTLPHFQDLRSCKAARLLLLKGIADSDPLADAFYTQQEQQWQQWLASLDMPRQLDASALGAVLVGGLSFLTLLAHQDRAMMGIDLRSQSGWQRIEEALNVLYRALERTHAAH